MQKDKKLIILIVLILVMIVVWMPKGRRGKRSLPQAPISLQERLSEVSQKARKRSEFLDWGRNPFVWTETGAGSISGLSLSGIIWDEEAPCAIINGIVVRSGEKIGGKIVKSIEPDKVILSDGAKEYVLELE